MTLEEAIAGVSRDIVRGVERRIDEGHYCVQTELLYPEGSLVEGFLDIGDDDGDHVLGRVVSDCGNTLAWLHDVADGPVVWERLDAMIDAVLRVHDAQRHGGKIVVRIGLSESLGAAILRLATGCAAITHQGLGLCNGLRGT